MTHAKGNKPAGAAPGEKNRALDPQRNARLFGEAVLHHRSGRTVEAESIYRAILADEPGNIGCLFHLGLLALGNGRNESALDFLSAAVERNGRIAPLRDAFGTALAASGRVGEAAAQHLEAIRLQNDFPEAWFNLGNALAEMDRHAEAIWALRNSIALAPGICQAYNNLGHSLVRCGRRAEAWRAFSRAIRIVPAFVEARNNLGNLLKEDGRFKEAAACFLEALGARPDMPEAHYNLANVLLAAGNRDQATGIFRRVVTLCPDMPEALNNLGTALHLADRTAEAEKAYRRTLRLAPDFAEAITNLATIAREKGDRSGAIAGYRRAIELEPSYALAHSNLAVALLGEGHWEEGLVEFEWREETAQQMGRPIPRLASRRWAGEPLAGRRLLLQAEQGYGDCLQFCRYAPLLADQGAEILLRVYPALVPLMRTLAGPKDVFSTDEAPPDHDFHLPMMSAPLFCASRPDNLPGNTPYLTAPPDRRAFWRQRLAGEVRPKVGLVWAGDGRPHDPYAQAVDRRRSLPLTSLSPLLQNRDICFVSLQKGAAGTQIRALKEELRPLDWMAEIDDFADTAALVSELDLVISVDTAVAHLAGALARPVWILSRFDGCWRWLQDRPDTPWYPTARLFRQMKAGDWDSVAARLARHLSRWPTV